MKLNKGDPCKVRLHTGEVVEAVYQSANNLGYKHHYLRLGDDMLIAVARVTLENWECRFIGKPCVLVPIGESNG